MPKQPFFNLEQHKQDEIKQIAMEEFIRHGYGGASTNRIVERLGISKGSLFYYFQGKEDLYTYLLREAQLTFIRRLQEKMGSWPKEILQRIKLLTLEGLQLYRELPLEQQLLNTIMDQNSTERRDQILGELGEESKKAFFALLMDVDTTHFRKSLEETLALVLWVYSGVKMEINQAYALSRDAEMVRRQIMPRLENALELLAKGIYKDQQEAE